MTANRPSPAVSNVQWCSKHNCARDVQSDCSTCHGDGEVEDNDDYSPLPRTRLCWSCGGSGFSPWLDCSTCLDEGENDDY